MNIKENNGVTLAELLVASILIGIVMLGVASFSVSISQLQSATNKSIVLAMRVEAVMARMTKDAYLAVGDEAYPGVLTAGANNRQSVCFRHYDTNDPVTYDEYSDDTWTCYFARPNRELWLCGDGAIPPVNNWGICNTGAGTRWLIDIENVNIADVVTTGGQFDYVEITVPAIYDRTEPAHPLENPTYTLTTQVSPPMHGR